MPLLGRTKNIGHQVLVLAELKRDMGLDGGHRLKNLLKLGKIVGLNVLEFVFPYVF